MKCSVASRKNWSSQNYHHHSTSTPSRQSQLSYAMEIMGAMIVNGFTDARSQMTRRRATVQVEGMYAQMGGTGSIALR